MEEDKNIDKKLEDGSKILSGALGTLSGAALLSKYGWKKLSPLTALKGTPLQVKKYKSLGNTAKKLAIASVLSGGYSAYKHYKNKTKDKK